MSAVVTLVVAVLAVVGLVTVAKVVITKIESLVSGTDSTPKA